MTREERAAAIIRRERDRLGFEVVAYPPRAGKTQRTIEELRTLLWEIALQLAEAEAEPGDK